MKQWLVQSQQPLNQNYTKIITMYKCRWHYTDHCLVNNSARNNRTGTMTCSNSINTPQIQRRQNRWCMYCWHETNQYMVSKQGSKRSNWNNNMFKVNSKCIRIMQTKWHRWCMLMTLDRSLYRGNIRNN